jgi:hypothetical protein
MEFTHSDLLHKTRGRYPDLPTGTPVHSWCNYRLYRMHPIKPWFIKPRAGTQARFIGRWSFFGRLPDPLPIIIYLFLGFCIVKIHAAMVVSLIKSWMRKCAANWSVAPIGKI